MTDGRVMRQSALVFSDMWRPRSIARSLSVRAGSCRPADRWHARRGRSRRALWPRLTAPLTRSSGFADGSLGAMLNPEPDAGQDAGLPGCVVLERRASMTDTKTLRNNRPNGIGDLSVANGLAISRGLVLAGTPASRVSPPLHPPGPAPARLLATFASTCSVRRRCAIKAMNPSIAKRLLAAGDSTSDLQRQNGASERKE